MSNRPNGTGSDVRDELTSFVHENRELITRLLANGDAETRGYALAAIANGGTVEDVEAIQAELEAIKEDRE